MGMLVATANKQEGRLLRNSYQATRDRQNTLYFILFVLPLIVGLVIFVVTPIVWGFIISLYDARGTVDLNNFVGIKNYIQLFKDKAFLNSIGMIIVFGIFMIPLTVIMALALAVMISKTRRGKGFFRTVFFIPMACSYVVASMVWRMSIFSGMGFGLVNTVIKVFGVSPILWTINKPQLWLVLCTVRLWLQVGLFMILYITGIEEIPSELYEAARVDGAEKGWVIFRHITFPLLRNTTIFVLFMNIINLFKTFDEFYNILVDSVSSSNLALARTPLIYLYETGFVGQDFGLSSAGAMIVALMIVVGTRIQSAITGSGKSVRD